MFKMLLVVCKNGLITLVFEKNANFFADNCRKLPKIVIRTSTLGFYAELQKGERCYKLLQCSHAIVSVWSLTYCAVFLS
jgi:hypothetical protein